MKKYYVYRHIRLDNNEPFYIGVGAKYRSNYTTLTSEYKRAFEKIRRKKLWYDIVEKTDYQVEILMEFDDYNEALKKETEFIKLYGRINNGSGCLANLTDGGQGAVGRIASKESVQKTVSAHIIPVVSKITGQVFPSIKEAANHFGIKPKTLANQLRHNNPRCSFKYLDESLNKPYLNKLFRPVKHKVTGKYFVSVSEAARHAGIKPNLFDFYLKKHPEKIDYELIQNETNAYKKTIKKKAA